MKESEFQQMSQDVLDRNPELKDYIQSAKPASKYGNARTIAKGLKFQSGKEANEISKLITLDEKHEIFGLRLQVKFPLPGGNSYIADAVYIDKYMNIHIVDVKGYSTKEFRIKAKAFKAEYGHVIELI